MKIGIDLLWVRPGKNGGTESYIRNLLNGFSQLEEAANSFILFVSEDNADSFEEYDMFNVVRCPVNTASFTKRVVWENVNLLTFGKKHGVNLWFFPVYSRPLFMNGFPNVTVIHDLQALHYPEYFSRFRNLYFKIAWNADCKNSSKVLTISEFCKKDIEKNYKKAIGKTDYIYNPILMTSDASDFNLLAKKYDIKKGEYFYTVSSLAKHKNLITLLKAFKILKDQGHSEILLITGVKVNAVNEVMDYIRENDLKDNIIYTGFISDEDRNALYDNCKTFLFPSVFEGFGMPPIEAMIRGVPVLTTKETSLYEVTEGKACYVENPLDEMEWVRKMQEKIPKMENNTSKHFAQKYSVQNISACYIELFNSLKLGGRRE
jgi:glycosyltransferase involved in cell wall biosynthesis